MRAVVLIILALILFLAGLGAGKTCWEALRKDEIMSTGRRSSTLVGKRSDPTSFWLNVAFNGVIAAGLLVGGSIVGIRAFRRPNARRAR